MINLSTTASIVIVVVTPIPQYIHKTDHKSTKQLFVLLAVISY